MEIIVQKLSRKKRWNTQQGWMLKIDSDESFWEPTDHDEYTQKMENLHKELAAFPCSNLSYNTWKFDTEAQLDKFMTYFLTKYGEGLKQYSYQEELDRATVDNYDQWVSHQWPSTGPSNVWDHYDVDYDQDGVAFDGWDKIGPGPKK